jgi:4-amino-4-deoxy-L-arabinose transferase-like glycosyltransferase
MFSPDHVAIVRAHRVQTRVSGRAQVRRIAESLAVVGLLIVAVLTRLPNLLAIPAFTDEVEEIALGLAILRHGAHPLTNVDPYIGALWNYLLAALFRLFGASIEMPRMAVLVAGVGTVLLTYVLGRIWHGPRPALLACLLMAASAAHIAVNSHVAWSNCITPLFTTLGLVVLSLALRDDRPRLLPAAGLVFGLALHTHPTALPVLVGAGFSAAIFRRAWLAGPWPYLSALMAVGANANLIVYNVMTDGRTLRYAQEVQASYEHEAGEATGYLGRLGDLLIGLARSLGAGLEQRASTFEYPADSLAIVAAVLVVIGLILAVRRGNRLGPLVVLATALILPTVNPKYDPILNVRYLAPILPICTIWMGLGLEWLGRPAERRIAGRSGPGSPLSYASRFSGVIAAGLLVTILVVGSLGALERYYDDVRENARTGQRILELANTARLLGPGAQPVILDERLDRMSLGPGAGIVLRVLDLVLEMEGVSTEVRWLGEERPQDIRAGQLVVLAARSKPRFTAEAVAGLNLRAPNGGPARVHSQASRYGLYRFGPGTVSPGKAAGSRASERDIRSGQVHAQPKGNQRAP